MLRKQIVLETESISEVSGVSVDIVCNFYLKVCTSFSSIHWNDGQLLYKSNL